MPKIPGAENLGGPGNVKSGRPVISGSDYGAGLIGRGIEHAGAAVTAISEEKRKQDDALELMKADTEFQDGLRATRRSFETDTDYKTFGPRFDEQVSPLAEGAASKITNPNSRAKWLERARQQSISSREHVLNRGLGLEREHKEVEVENDLSKGQGAYASTRDPIERKRILDGMIEKATLAERTGLIRPKKAEEYRDRFVDQTIALDIEERLYDDPEGVLRDLGLVPGGKKPASPTASGPLKIEPAGEHSIVHAGSGAKFRVSGTYADRFAGLIADLEALGVEVKGEQSGGYAKRNIRGTNTPSKHSHGEAIDINWHENAEGKKGSIAERIGDEKVRELARKHGLKWGGDFKSRSRDDMHFEVDRDAVVRRDLPPAVPAESPDPAPDVIPFGEPDAPSGDPDNPTKAQYAMLSGRRRQVMLNKARIALSHKYQQRLANDIARIEDGEDEEVDERGETNFDKARRVLLPNVLAQWQTKKDRATLKRDSIRALKDMPEDQVDDHIRGIGRDPRTGEERQDIGYATIRGVRVQAEKEWEKIREQRRKDPAGAVGQSPEVRKALAAMQGRRGAEIIGVDENGEPTIAREGVSPTDRKAAAQQIVEATIAAQERLGISKNFQRTISKRQAEKLLDMRNPTELTSQQQREALSGAAQRANELFGPEMGERVMRDALVLAFHPSADNLRDYMNRGRGVFRESSAAADERFALIAKQAFGRPVTARDMNKLTMLERLDAIPPILPEPGFDPGRPVIGQPYQSPVREMRPPNERQAQLLMQQIGTDPSKASAFREQFDAKFGEGAAQRVINRMMSGEKDPR